MRSPWGVSRWRKEFKTVSLGAFQCNRSGQCTRSELAKKARRGVTCEVVGDPGGCECWPGSQVKKVFQGQEHEQSVDQTVLQSSKVRAGN